VSLFASNINTPASPYGATPYYYGYGSNPYWACGYNPWYGTPAYYNTWYSPYNYCGYPWYVARYGGIFRFAWYQKRWSFGFGFAYSPSYAYGSYYGGWTGCWDYPFYRVYDYYPYCYYNAVTYYPAYSTVYHSDAVVGYADAADPYVEFVDSVPEVALDAPVPEAFQAPLVTDFPEGLAYAELLARGAAWMREGEHMMAAEAYRRAWVSSPGGYLSPLELSVALFAAGGKYDLSGFALHESLDRDAGSISRDPDLTDDFTAARDLIAATDALKRHVVKDPADGEARFVLGAVLLWSGDPFAARNEFNELKAGEWSSTHLPALLAEAEARILGDR